MKMARRAKKAGLGCGLVRKSKAGDGKGAKPSDGEATKPSDDQAAEANDGKATRPSDGEAAGPSDAEEIMAHPWFSCINWTAIYNKQ